MSDSEQQREMQETAALRRVTGGSQLRKYKALTAVLGLSAAALGVTVGILATQDNAASTQQDASTGSMAAASTPTSIAADGDASTLPQYVAVSEDKAASALVNIDRVFPRSGSPKGGYQVEILGNFGCLSQDDAGKLEVKLGGVPVQQVVSISPKKLVVIAGAAPSATTHGVSVRKLYAPRPNERLDICGAVFNEGFLSYGRTFKYSAQAETPFLHGVASGDPLTDSVILWTRVTQSGADAGKPVNVQWTMFEDEEFTTVVQKGVFKTDASRDYTVKVDVKGLEAGTKYYYKFAVQNEGESFEIDGSTNTLPEDDTDNFRIATVSCSSMPHGYFNGYEALSQRTDVDLIIDLGDYIYEYNEGGYGANQLGRLDRPSVPQNEIVTLQDYRMRHLQYKEDYQLQAAHKHVPWITTWDDHETTNNAWDPDLEGPDGGAANHNAGECQDTPLPDGSEDCTWESRKANAAQAYFEYLPIRDEGGYSTDPAIGFNDPTLHRKFSIGNLAEVIVLDTRAAGRELQGEGNEEERRIMSAEQDEFLQNALREAQNPTDGREPRKWKLVAQQVQIGHVLLTPGVALAENDYLVPPTPFNDDTWDGYPGHRQDIVDFVKDEGIENFVVLTGDIHSGWATELVQTPAYPALLSTERYGVEFVTTSVTSPAFGSIAPSLEVGVLISSPHVKYADFNGHGYSVLDLNKDRAQNEWFQVSDIYTQGVFTVCRDATYSVADGEKTLVAGTEGTGDAADIPACLTEKVAGPPECPLTGCRAASPSLPSFDSLWPNKGAREGQTEVTLVADFGCLAEPDTEEQKLIVLVDGVQAEVVSRSANKVVVKTGEAVANATGRGAVGIFKTVIKDHAPMGEKLDHICGDAVFSDAAFYYE